MVCGQEGFFSIPLLSFALFTWNMQKITPVLQATKSNSSEISEIGEHFEIVAILHYEQSFQAF